MTNYLVMDLETCRAEDVRRRKDAVRLGGTLDSSGPVLSTSGDEIAERCAATDMLITHNGAAFDHVALAMHHGLDLPSLWGRTWDNDFAARQLDPPRSGKDDASAMPRGYYGLDAVCQRLRVAGKAADLGKLSEPFWRLANKLRDGKTLKPDEAARDDLRAVQDLLESAVMRDGRLDKYCCVPVTDPDYRRYLVQDLEATKAAAWKLVPPKGTRDRAYLERENNIGLITGQMTVNGLRVDLNELEGTLVQQRIRKREMISELGRLVGVELTGESPNRSKAGNAAIEEALVSLGIKREALPRAEKTGWLATGKDKIADFRDGEYFSRLRTFADTDDRRTRLADIDRILDLTVKISGERTVYQTAESFRIGEMVHPTIRPTQASGRWSVTGPGLTVYGKRKGRHVERRIFVPDRPDADGPHVLVTIDADQVDARGVAAHSGDLGYLMIFRNGLDLHGEVALQIFGDRSRREDVKAISHGWNYGESVRKIAEGGVPLELAEQYDREMREKYPDLVEWQATVRAIGSSGGLLDNGFGRKLRCTPQFAYTQAPAQVGQGCTRDIMAEMAIRLVTAEPRFWRYLKTIVHDEFVFSFPARYAEELTRLAMSLMTFDLAEATDGKLASIPITVGNSKLGLNWADCYTACEVCEDRSKAKACMDVTHLNQRALYAAAA